ncbi:MAG: ComEC/Rec2 family competence protein [Alphaproteobacteria bacterium]
MSDVKIEIDFLPVGDGEKSGDAIAIRYGDENELFVHVVDGGTQESGEALVGHINQYYDNPTWVDNLVCTHGDDDHSSGLRTVIENFNVGKIWMNRPWLYASELTQSFKGNWSAEGLRKNLRESFPILAEIEDMANDRGIIIEEAFQGKHIGPFIIASPSRQFYLSLIPHFSRTPEPVEEAKQGFSFLKFLGEAGKSMAYAASKLVPDSWDIEYLPGGETAASNESSVVQYAHFGDKRIMLTGDAGLEALNRATDFLHAHGYKTQNMNLIQIPHHGSRRNVSTQVLNKLIGASIIRDGSVGSAYVSASKGESDHPRKRVLNAFTRRGYQVHSTEGTTKGYNHNIPMKPGWSSAEPHPFYDHVEEEGVA